MISAEQMRTLHATHSEDYGIKSELDRIEGLLRQHAVDSTARLISIRVNKDRSECVYKILVEQGYSVYMSTPWFSKDGCELTISW